MKSSGTTLVGSTRPFLRHASLNSAMVVPAETVTSGFFRSERSTVMPFSFAVKMRKSSVGTSGAQECEVPVTRIFFFCARAVAMMAMTSSTVSGKKTRSGNAERFRDQLCHGRPRRPSNRNAIAAPSGRTLRQAEARLVRRRRARQLAKQLAVAARDVRVRGVDRIPFQFAVDVPQPERRDRREHVVLDAVRDVG